MKISTMDASSSRESSFTISISSKARVLVHELHLCVAGARTVRVVIPDHDAAPAPMGIFFGKWSVAAMVIWKNMNRGARR